MKKINKRRTRVSDVPILRQWLCLKDVSLHGKTFLKVCRQKNCSFAKVSPDLLIFALKCITQLIHSPNRFRFSFNQKQILKEMLSPYKKEFTLLADYNRRGFVIKKIQNQTGSGLLLSSLISAVVPLITSLIQKIFKKRK